MNIFNIYNLEYNVNSYMTGERQIPKYSLFLKIRFPSTYTYMLHALSVTTKLFVESPSHDSDLVWPEINTYLPSAPLM